MKPDITINQLLTVQGGATRLAYNKIDSSLYYSTYFGNIYKVIIHSSGNVYDTLVYSSIETGVNTVQGMDFRDSILYISGNNNPDSLFTTGIIVGGKLQTNGTRNWITLAQTVPYPTTVIFNHLFSGMTVNQNGDSIYICSGSRGDHGEIESRGGIYPGVRNLALTSVILKISTSAVNLIIPNDSVALDAMGLVYARGIRNTYDFGYNAVGDLFGAENSGDRDMSDELNWLRPGLHYGFPWMMGSTYNPQQFAGYDSSTDIMINHHSLAWKNSTYYNDPGFPQIPNGLQFTLPCGNVGPDGSFARDSITGVTYNAAAANETINSFTPHRSPLGLTFDKDSILDSTYRGRGFILSYTRGNNLLPDSSALLTPFNDNSEDLLLLDLQKDTLNNNYSFHATKIVEGFSSPVDAVLRDTNLYIIENGYSGFQSIWNLHLPRNPTGINSVKENNLFNTIDVYPNPADKIINFDFKNISSHENIEMSISTSSGQQLISREKINNSNIYSINTNNYSTGIYNYIITQKNKIILKGHFEVVH